MKVSLRRWLALLFVCMIALTVVTAILWSYATGYETIMNQSETNALNCFGFVSHLLRTQDPSLLTAKNADLPQAVKEDFIRLSDAFDMTYLYVYRVNEDARNRYYLLATCSGDDGTFLDAMRRIEADNTDGIDDMERDALNGSEDSHRFKLDNSFGFTMSWLVPYKDAAGNVAALIGGEYDLSILREEILRQATSIAIPIVFVQILAFVILVISINRRIAEPVLQISNAMKRFAETRELPALKTKHKPVAEVAEIRETFKSTASDVNAYIADIEALTQERVQVETQERVARRIQYGLVPEETKLNGDNFSVIARTRPAKAVGGDFYDCFRREDGNVCVVVGDVSGKGVSAAIFMAMARTTIHDQLFGCADPGVALTRANRDLCRLNPEGLFATVFAAVLDPATGRLTYANAGHCYPVLVRESAAFLIPKPGAPLGLFDDDEIADEETALLPEQTILIYTDGVTEAVNRDKAFFGDDRLLEALSRGAENAQDVMRCVSDALDAFCGDCDPFDDTAMLALHWSESARDIILPAKQSAFAQIRDAVIAEAGDTPRTREILLACEEIMTNIVSYAGVETFGFRLSHSGALTATFTDAGPAFDPTLQTEQPAFDLLDNGGMGLGLVRQIANTMRYERKDDQNVLTLTFNL